jgi:hypothetical protein
MPPGSLAFHGGFRNSLREYPIFLSGEERSGLPCLVLSAFRGLGVYHVTLV